MDDLGGWGPKAWDLLQDRVDALRADVNVLMGKQAPVSETNGVRPFGIGLATWAVLLTGFGGLLAGIAAVIGAGS
jgi:hypothetical protein